MRVVVLALIMPVQLLAPVAGPAVPIAVTPAVERVTPLAPVAAQIVLSVLPQVPMEIVHVTTAGSLS